MGAGSADLVHMLRHGAGPFPSTPMTIALTTPKGKPGGVLEVAVSFALLEFDASSSGAAGSLRTFESSHNVTKIKSSRRGSVMVASGGGGKRVSGAVPEEHAVRAKSELKMEAGQLKVTVLRGENVRNAQKGKFTISKQDPYVKLRPTWAPRDGWKETGVCQNGGTNPTWDPDKKKHAPTTLGFGFDPKRYQELVDDGQFRAELEVRVLNTNKGREDVIGTGVLDLDAILGSLDPAVAGGGTLPATEAILSLRFGEETAGDLYLSIEFHPHVEEKGAAGDGGSGGSGDGGGGGMSVSGGAAPECKTTTCGQCQKQATTCYRDSSEAYDADGDGKLDDHEKGGFYCETCWTEVYGSPPKKRTAIRQSLGVPPGRLVVTVKRGIKLKNVEKMMFKMDPYVKVKPGWSEEWRQTLPAYDQHKDPVWSAKEHEAALVFEFDGLARGAENARAALFDLTVEVNDKEKSGTDKYIGTGSVVVAEQMRRPALPEKSETEENYPVTGQDKVEHAAWMAKTRIDWTVDILSKAGKPAGSILLEAVFTPTAPKSAFHDELPQSCELEEEEVDVELPAGVCGSLVVDVHEAANVKDADVGEGTSDSYVTVTLEPRPRKGGGGFDLTQQMTKILPNGGDRPVWDEALTFPCFRRIGDSGDDKEHAKTSNNNKYVKGEVTVAVSLRKQHVLTNEEQKVFDVGEKAKLESLVAQVQIRSARGLAKADGVFGKSDPYAVLLFGGEEVGRTEVVKSNLNPTWNDGDFAVDIEFPKKLIAAAKSHFRGGGGGQGPRLFVEVFDNDKVGDNEFLGRAVLDMAVLVGGNLKSFGTTGDLDEQVLALEPREGTTEKEAKYVKGEVVVGVALVHRVAAAERYDDPDDDPVWNDEVEGKEGKAKGDGEGKDAKVADDRYDALVATVIVRGAMGLAKADTFGKSDPYARVMFGGVEVGRTEIVKKNLNPLWENGTFEVRFPPVDARGLKTLDDIRVEIHDNDNIGKDEFLGEVAVNLAKHGGVIDEGGGGAIVGAPPPSEHVLPLQARRAEISLGVILRRKGVMTAQELQEVAEAAIEQDLIATVHIRGARGIAKADTFGKSDPYAVLLLDGEEVGRTEVIKSTLDPTWTTDQFEVEVGIPKGIIDAGWEKTPRLAVEVHDYDKIGGNDFLGRATLDVVALAHGVRDSGGSTGHEDLSEHVLPLEPREESSANASVKGEVVVGIALTRKALETVYVAAGGVDGVGGIDDAKEETNTERETKNVAADETCIAAQEGKSADVSSSMQRYQVLVGTVIVRGASGLAKSDMFGKSDPYAIVTLDGEEVGRTEVVQKSLSPEWQNGEFEIHFPPVDSLKSLGIVCVEIHDKDKVGKDEFLGEVVLDMTKHGGGVRDLENSDPPTELLLPLTLKDKVNNNPRLRFELKDQDTMMGLDALAKDDLLGSKAVELADLLEGGSSIGEGGGGESKYEGKHGGAGSEGKARKTVLELENGSKEKSAKKGKKTTKRKAKDAAKAADITTLTIGVQFRPIAVEETLTDLIKGREGVLFVYAMQAQHLKNVEGGLFTKGNNDPFLQVRLRPKASDDFVVKGKVGWEKTHRQDNAGASVRWDEWLAIRVEAADAASFLAHGGAALQIVVFDHNSVQKSKMIGAAQVDCDLLLRKPGGICLGLSAGLSESVASGAASPCGNVVVAAMFVPDPPLVPILVLPVKHDMGVQESPRAEDVVIVAKEWKPEKKEEILEGWIQIGPRRVSVDSTTLKLEDIDLGMLPADMARLTELRTLDLARLNISVVAPLIGNMVHLTHLSVSGEFLMSVPPEIGMLQHLETLSLCSSRLSWLPDEIGTLSRLRSLILTNNMLECLPDSTGKLDTLELLVAFGNRLPVLPNTVNWPRLRHLDLHKNILTSLPASFGTNGTTCLEYLDLSSNLLTDLPASLCELTGLQSLLLADNQLVALPEAIGNMYRLNSLQLNRNRLTRLPDSTCDLTALRKLNIEANPLEPLVDMDMWDYGDESIRLTNVKHEFALIAGDVVPEDEDPAELLDKVRKTGLPGARDGVIPVPGTPMLCPDHFTIYGCPLGDRCQFSHTAPPPLAFPQQRQKEVLATRRAKEPPFEYYGHEFKGYRDLYPEKELPSPPVVMRVEEFCGDDDEGKGKK